MGFETAAYRSVPYKRAIKHMLGVKGMTQHEFAKIVGVSSGVVNEWIRRDDRHPSASNWERIVESFPCLADCAHDEFRDVYPESQLLADRVKELEAENKKLREENARLKRAPCHIPGSHVH